ncbi:MAG: F0F1 ATP synthase subunit B [Anaerovoracaceae bacterium]|jgi:F-type H+-transporting ATPase subunit b
MKLVQPFLELNWDLLLSIINFLVIYLIFRHFFFDKVHDFMVKREKEVQDKLDHAAETDRQAEEKMQAYNEKIANVDRESREIIKKAKDEADFQSQEILDEANERARQMLERSEEEIRRDKYNAQKELRDEVGNLASMAAGKILEKEIDPKDHQELINRVIEEAEDEPWS